MKISSLAVISSLCLATSMAQAQSSPEVEQLKQQLLQMQQNFERIQREQKQQIDSLQKQLDALQEKSSPPPSDSAAETAHDHASHDMEEESHDDHDHGWDPSHPIRIGKEKDAHLDLRLIGTFAVGGSTADDLEHLQIGGHDPNQNGITVQGLELGLSGVVDPYFRGAGNILFGLDANNETLIELEEAWLETVSLPWDLKIRGGQIYTDFGRHNAEHPHAWGFVDSPLVNARLLGPDGLRNPGIRLSWVAPTPWTSELFFAIQDSQGSTAASFRSSGHHHHGEEEEEELPFAYRHAENDRGVGSIDDLLLTPRYATSFHLSDAQTLHLGASAAFGPNSSGGSGNTATQIYGLDLTWKWRPKSHEHGFPFVAWQTEAMLRRFQAGAFDWDEGGNGGDADGDGNVDEGILVNGTTGLPASFNRETLVDYGFYTQLQYGFRKGWVAGLRFDYLAGDTGDYEKIPLLVADGSGGGDALGRDLFRGDRWRISPNLTWFPTEFSKLRLQYNYDDRRDFGIDHSVWLQFEFMLGAHPAH